jgi:hypothetical protein
MIIPVNRLIYYLPDGSTIIVYGIAYYNIIMAAWVTGSNGKKCSSGILLIVI